MEARGTYEAGILVGIGITASTRHESFDIVALPTPAAEEQTRFARVHAGDEADARLPTLPDHGNRGIARRYSAFQRECKMYDEIVNKNIKVSDNPTPLRTRNTI